MGHVERRRRVVTTEATILAAVLALGVIAPARIATAAEWPPADPGQEQAAVALDRAWAVEHRDMRDFADLQQAAGTKGRIEAYDLKAPFPRAIYGWTGRAGDGRMQAFLYEDGSFAAVVSPAGSTSKITFNSFGGFLCPACDPPVSACGRRPSWIPHDVHWDTFDCESTLTGPMPEFR